LRSKFHGYAVFGFDLFLADWTLYSSPVSALLDYAFLCGLGDQMATGKHDGGLAPRMHFLGDGT
jgi:hypothetical protein